MVLSMEQYEALRRDFLNVAKYHVTPVTLNNLKSHYAEAINSVRTLDRIQDIEYLIRVLEKRGVIRYNNITPLKHIAKLYFEYSPINDKLDQYDVWLKSYIPHYPPHTNLYRLPSGEFHLRNRYLNDLSSTNFKKGSPDDSNLKSCLEYQFAYKLPSCLISDKDLSYCGNSILSTSSLNDRLNAKVLFQSSFSSNENHKTKSINNDQKVYIVHNITIPSKLAIESEQTLVLQKNCSTPLLVEEKLNENQIAPETSALPTPPSPRSQSSSQIHNTLSDQSLLSLIRTKNLNKKNSLNKLMRTRRVQIFLMILFLALLLTMALIISNLLKHSVQHNAEPTAPSLEAVYSGSTETYGNRLFGNDLLWNPNGATDLYQRSGRNATCFPVIPRSSLQTLSEIERMRQHMVFERVSEMLGSYWPDVARYLDVREFEIDKIEAYYNCDLTVKAFTALKIFARDTDPNNWQKKLKKALQEARRKDLSEMVDEMLSRK